MLCDLLTTDGQPVEVSPRRILRRQIERAAELGLEVRCATELEFYLFLDSFAEAAGKRWHGLVPHCRTIEDYQLLQTSARGVRHRPDPQPDGRRPGIPVEFSKGEAGAGQHEINVTYGDALEVADRHLVFKNGVKEIASELGRAATFMAKWSMDSAGSSCHIHASLWDANTGAPLMAPPGDEPASGGLSRCRPAVPGRPAPVGRRAGVVLCPVRQFLPSLRSRLVGTHRGGVGRGQPHLRVPHRRHRRRPAGGEPHPGGRRQPVPGAGRHHRRRSVGNRARARARPAVHRQCLRARPTSPASRPPWPRPSTRWRPAEVAAEAFGPEVHDHLLNTARQEWAAANRVVTDWELARNFERI